MKEYKEPVVVLNKGEVGVKANYLDYSGDSNAVAEFKMNIAYHLTREQDVQSWKVLYALDHIPNSMYGAVIWYRAKSIDIHPDFNLNVARLADAIFMMLTVCEIPHSRSLIETFIYNQITK